MFFAFSMWPCFLNFSTYFSTDGFGIGLLFCCMSFPYPFSFICTSSPFTVRFLLISFQNFFLRNFTSGCFLRSLFLNWLYFYPALSARFRTNLNPASDLFSLSLPGSPDLVFVFCPSFAKVFSRRLFP